MLLAASSPTIAKELFISGKGIETQSRFDGDPDWQVLTTTLNERAQREISLNPFQDVRDAMIDAMIEDFSIPSLISSDNIEGFPVGGLATSVEVLE